MARSGGEQPQTKTGSAGHPSAMLKRQNSHERLLKPAGGRRWKEEYINGHAMFLGCLMMVVRGLGFLMLTWITVVLLGGYVSNLGTFDFWPLTVIALLQIIGVFSFFHVLKYRDIRYLRPNLFPCCGRGCGCDPFDWIGSCMGKLSNRYAMSNGCLALVLGVIFLIAVVLMAMVSIVAVFLFLVVCLGIIMVIFGAFLPLTILGFFLVVTVVRYGPVVVAMWSMARIVVLGFRTLFFTSASDGPGMFGSKNDASRLPNLIPAVDAAYWLGVAQGAVLLYWHLCSRGYTRIVKDVISGLGLESESATVWHYWRETAAGCEKDLAFAAGRNLMTYAVELLESKSPDKFLSGIRILGRVIGLFFREADPPPGLSREELLEKVALTKQLLTGSPSFCHLIEKLLQMLGPRSPYCPVIRGHTARILLIVAHEIQLEEHPRCMQCISSLLDAFEHHQNPPYAYQRVSQLRDTPYERDWCLEWHERRCLVETCWESQSGCLGHDRQCDLYMNMVWLGLSILDKLAADEHNCSVISSTDGLLSRIMAPVCSDVLHCINHRSWVAIVAKSLAVMCHLAAAPGEAGRTIRRNISFNKDAICSMQGILWCQTCSYYVRELAVELLTLLCRDASPNMQEITTELIQLLINKFNFADSENATTLVGRKLAMMLSSQRAEIVLTLDDNILDLLKRISLNHPSRTHRIIALEIMEHLCGGDYSIDELCHKNIKTAMTDVMPQVLRELFYCDVQTGETEQGRVESPETEANINNAQDDVENQNASSQGNSQSDSYSSHQQNSEAEEKETTKLQTALLSLSAIFFDKFASADQNLPRLLDEVAASSFALKLVEMVEANMQPTPDSLRNIKMITKLVISLVTHGVRYVTEDMDRLMTSLTSASNKMMNLDGLMLCSGVDGGANKGFSTLCSLLEEAQELVNSRKATGSSMNN